MDRINWSTINWTDLELDRLRSFFEAIKQGVNAPLTKENFSALIYNCDFLFSFFPIPVIEINQDKLIRARRNMNGEIFSAQHEISYNSRNPEFIKLGRFNLAEEGLFYGAVPLESAMASYLPTAILEACKELVDDTNKEMTFDFTVGYWRVKPFMALCLCFDEKHFLHNEHMAKNISEFKQCIDEACDLKSASFIHEVLNYISALSSTPKPTEGCYMVLNAIFKSLCKTYANNHQQVYAAIYPSSITESKGLNIVISQDIVDTNLTLDSVVAFTAQRRPDDLKQLDMLQVSKVAHVLDGRFTIKLEHLE